MQSIKRDLEVLDSISDVMKTLTSAFKEAAHGRIRCERAQILDEALADREHDYFDPLTLDTMTRRRCQHEPTRVSDRSIKIMDGDADMIDSEGDERIGTHELIIAAPPVRRGRAIERGRTKSCSSMLAALST